MTARLSLLDSSEQQESPWADHEPPHAEPPRPISVDPPHDPSPWGSQHSIKISAPQEIYLQGGQTNPYAPALVVQSADGGPADDSYGLPPPHAEGRLGSDAGINTPSMISTATSATSHELIDLEIPSGALGVDTDLIRVPRPWIPTRLIRRAKNHCWTLETHRQARSLNSPQGMCRTRASHRYRAGIFLPRKQPGKRNNERKLTRFAK